MRNIFCTLCGKKHAPCFSLTSNADEVLRDKIIQHAYLAHNSRVTTTRITNPVIPPTEKTDVARLISLARGKEAKNVRCSILFDARALMLGMGMCRASRRVLRGPRNPIFMRFIAGSRFLNTFEQ